MNEQTVTLVTQNTPYHSFHFQHRPKSSTSFVIHASLIPHFIFAFVYFYSPHLPVGMVHCRSNFFLSFLLCFSFVHSSFCISSSSLHLPIHFICHCWRHLGSGTISLGKKVGFQFLHRMELFN